MAQRNIEIQVKKKEKRENRKKNKIEKHITSGKLFGDYKCENDNFYLLNHTLNCEHHHSILFHFSLLV